MGISSLGILGGIVGVGISGAAIVAPEPGTTVLGFAGFNIAIGQTVLSLANLMDAIADKPNVPDIPSGIFELTGNAVTYKGSTKNKELAKKFGQIADLATGLINSGVDPGKIAKILDNAAKAGQSIDSIIESLEELKPKSGGEGQGK